MLRYTQADLDGVVAAINAEVDQPPLSFVRDHTQRFFLRFGELWCHGYPGKDVPVLARRPKNAMYEALCAFLRGVVAGKRYGNVEVRHGAEH